MSKKGWLEIMDLDKLINFSRKLVFLNFDPKNDALSDNRFFKKIEDENLSKKDQAEMDEVLSFDESLSIFKEFIKKSKKDQQWYMKELDYDIILENLNERMVSNIIRSLVKKGFLESAFDNEKNDFVFWVKSNENDK